MLKVTRQWLAFPTALALCGSGWAQTAKPKEGPSGGGHLATGLSAGRSAPATITKGSNGPYKPVIPRVWDDAAMEKLELPRASKVKIHELPSEYYYRIPERTIWKTYPIYAPGKEPAGYWKWLQQQEPKKAVEWDKLRTKADWIHAGSLVFESGADYSDPMKGFLSVRDPDWFKATEVKTTPDGVMPYYRYVVRQKGKVEVTLDSCASCHTRVMPDGTLVRGAQGNIPFGRVFAYGIRRIPPDRPDTIFSDLFYAAPWIKPDPTLPLSSKDIATFAAHLRTIPEGVNPRQGTSAMYPIQIPDLIGVKDRMYLDRTGLQPHHGILDLMRYDAVQNFINEVREYDGFIPANDPGDTKLPDPATLTRESDQALYALALYVYSLKPPPNPNRFDSVAAKGKKIFAREGCPKCHTPPLYTNNMLTPAEGFMVTEEEQKAYRVMPVVVGTDSFNALNTRRGTGFYKVPSLKGVWYRGPFQHNGSVATLEDWFDIHRLDEDYVPTGYRGYDTPTHPVAGHEFGLDLTPEEKRELIAFLRTL
jgi:hypothetical protein